MKVCVVGGGAGGMISACAAAANGHTVTLLEHNEKLGKKVYITGKGRCNLTNLCSAQDFLSNVITNSKFLYSAINKYPPSYVYSYFEDFLGLPLTVERGNRVFPTSNKASDVTSALKRYLISQNVQILLNTEVVSLNIVDNSVVSLTTITNIIPCDAVILATGGLSYPQTGSNGSGYALAKSAGHTITETKPSLVDIVCKDCSALCGLSLKNVTATLVDSRGNEIYHEFGEMLFTDCGMSGPIILTLSAYATKIDLYKAKISLNLKPALSAEQLDARLVREFEEFPNKTLKNCLLNLLPERLICFIISRCGLDENIKVNAITKQSRQRIVQTLQNLTFDVLSVGDFSRAVITSGGINVREINPATMQSKIVNNLYFAGEIMDVDAKTGGFNLQIAFCTGLLAGNSIKE